MRKRLLPLPIPLRGLPAAPPGLVTLLLQVVRVVQRVLTRHRLDSAQLEADEGRGGAVTLSQRLGSAANLNTRLRGLLLDGGVSAWRRWCAGVRRSGLAHQRRGACAPPVVA